MRTARLLDAELEAREVGGVLLELPGEEIPDAEIFANGFVNLSPDQLADFALSSAHWRRSRSSSTATPTGNPATGLPPPYWTTCDYAARRPRRHDAAESASRHFAQSTGSSPWPVAHRPRLNPAGGRLLCRGALG